MEHYPTVLVSDDFKSHGSDLFHKFVIFVYIVEGDRVGLSRFSCLMMQVSSGIMILGFYVWTFSRIWSFLKWKNPEAQMGCVSVGNSQPGRGPPDSQSSIVSLRFLLTTDLIVDLRYAAASQHFSPLVRG